MNPFLTVVAKKRAAVGGGGGATISYIGGAFGTVNTMQNPQVTKNLTTGNSVFITLYWDDAARTPSITDTAGNTYTNVVQTNQGGHQYVAIAKAENITGGTPVLITCDFGSTTQFCCIGVSEFHKSTGFPTLDDFDVGSGTGTAATTAALTTTTASGGLVCVMGLYNPGTYTPGSGWTEDNDATYYVEHRITTVAGSYVGNATISSSQTWAACAAAFK